jgi:ELWxxDGT repeat protein/VCBS repeat-containing protein
VIFAGGEEIFDGPNPLRTSLWVTDGTASGTHELTSIVGASRTLIEDPRFNGQVPLNVRDWKLTVFNSEVLFNGVNTSEQHGLWVTDGTASGTHEITGIVGANQLGVNPLGITVFNGEALFSGTNASGQRGLWLTDGTAAGTHEITGIVGANQLGLNPVLMTVVGGEVLFNGLDAGGQQGLWVTDGTAAGTHELTGIAGAYVSGLNPNFFTPFDLNNHPPTIDSAHSTLSRTIDEVPNVTGSTALDIANGAIAFTDADLNDRPTASVIHQSVVYHDAHGNDVTAKLSPAQITNFEKAFLPVPAVGNTNNGAIDWGYTVADKSLDFLGADESLMVTSRIEIDDHHGGGTVDQEVTITIHGADDAPSNKVFNSDQVSSSQIALEMVKLAIDAYPDAPVPGFYHTSNPLTPSRGVPQDSNAQRDIQADNWHAVSASEFGLNQSGQHGSIQYSFVNGYYQAIDPCDALDLDPSEGDALVLTGLVNGKVTLAISFAGTDQLSDWLDFVNFSTHYAKFAPLVSAIKSYIDNNPVDQVFVSGHSLGAAMVQYFIEDPIFENDPRFHAQAWTIGSPGADNLSPPTSWSASGGNLVSP